MFRKIDEKVLSQTMTVFNISLVRFYLDKLRWELNFVMIYFILSQEAVQPGYCHINNQSLKTNKIYDRPELLGSKLGNFRFACVFKAEK
jgi:hypothetical protein